MKHTEKKRCESGCYGDFLKPTIIGNDMETKFLKRKNDGLVINTMSDYDKYLLEKKQVKVLAKTKNELSEVKSELKDIKDLLQQLIKAKDI